MQQADSLSDISEILVPNRTARDVVLKMTKEKRKSCVMFVMHASSHVRLSCNVLSTVARMRKIAKVENAVVRVSDTALLARFKPGHELVKPKKGKLANRMDPEEVFRENSCDVETLCH